MLRINYNGLLEVMKLGDILFVEEQSRYYFITKIDDKNCFWELYSKLNTTFVTDWERRIDNISTAYYEVEHYEIIDGSNRVDNVTDFITVPFFREFVESYPIGIPILVMGLHEAEYIRVDRDYVVGRRLSPSIEYDYKLMPINSLASAQWVVCEIDLYSNSKVKVRTACVCDWNSVKMIGCKCGAIIPYVGGL